MALTALAGIGVVKLKRRFSQRRFHRTYITPTVAAIRPALGDVDVRLHVSADLGNLTPRLATPLSPAEKAVRAWYGEHVEPKIRWLPERAMRGWWAARKRARPVTSKLEKFRRPTVEVPSSRIELTFRTPYLTKEQRQLVSSVISAKVPVSNLVESWDMVGDVVTARWTVRRRPPEEVGKADLVARFAALPEHVFFVGLGAGSAAMTVNLKSDSPHIAVSASTGAGKSVLACAIGVQVLMRGGQVVILDIKAGHRWAMGLPGVVYCTSPEQIHDALVRLGAKVLRDNQRALQEPDGWEPDRRTLVILEEVNSTVDLLLDHWAETRDKSDPKKSPAVKGLKQILTMGRSAKVNVVGIAQSLTARAIGGPESRENFAIRCLARYTVNAWKMLVPEAAMPRSSRKLGRWQIVVAGVATETQVCYLSPWEARSLVYAAVPASPANVEEALMGPGLDLSPGSPGNGDMPVDPLSVSVTLRQATDRGILPWKFEAAKKRLQRARKDGSATLPKPVGKDGNADLYAIGDLIVWAESERVS